MRVVNKTENNIEAEKPDIIMFSSPKTVKKKKMSDIIFTQTAFCVIFFAILALIKVFVPDIYQNIEVFLNEFVL